MQFFIESVCIDVQIKPNSSEVNTQLNNHNYQNRAINYQKST